MPWNEAQMQRTLIIQRTGREPNAQYRLHPYMRVMTNEGQSFMEPLPSGPISLAHMGIMFTRVEFIEPPGSGQYGGGDTMLTRDTNEGILRLGSDGAE